MTGLDVYSSRRISFHFGAEAGDTGKIFVSRKYLETVVIEHITPQPDHVEAATEWLIYYSFTRQGPTSVIFHLKPDKFGLLSGEARLAHGEPITFTQFIYP